jgi:ribosomal protein S18 acetylase RimI-like enzyme
MDSFARTSVTHAPGPRDALVVVRTAATDSEIAAAGALTAEAYHADRLINDDDEYADELRDASRRAREATLLVAALPGDDEDVVVGTITIAPAGSSYAEVARPGEVELRMLGVAPEARRRGIAEALMRASMRETVALGAGAVVLSTLGTMTTAQRLYDRLGFRREPDRDWGHEGVGLRVYSWHVPKAPGVRVETATWRAVEVRDVDGWQVGLSGGFTRRANSAVPVHGSDVREAPLEATLDAVEARYREAGLASVVRVGRSPEDDALDGVLAARGYTVTSRTWVMVLDLPAAAVTVRPGAGTSGSAVDDSDVDGSDVDESDVADDGVGDLRSAPARTDAAAPDLRVTLAAEPDTEWLACWLAVKTGADEPDTSVARAVVTGSPALYLSARDRDGVVGVLRAALADDWVALSCLAVSARGRGHGLARTLTAVALEVATGRGARHAFLQVEDENSVARRLYESLGFVPAERYHYRER